MAKVKSLTKVVKKLVQKNPALREIVEDNPTQSYAALKAVVTKPMTAAIGAKCEGYITQHKLIWSIINEVNGSNEGSNLDLDF
jgi:hypothetical protein